MRRLVGWVVLVLLGVALPWFWYSRAPSSPVPEQPPAAEESAAPSGVRPPARTSTFVPSFFRRSPLATEPARVRTDRSAGAGVMAGEVLSAVTNEPVADAELTFARGERVSSVMTNSAGFFIFEASQPGRYLLVSVTAEGFFPFAPQWGHSPLRLTAQQGRRIENVIVHLEPAIPRRGRVQSPTGQGVAQAEVTLFSSRQGLALGGVGPDRVVTDEQGEFTFRAPLGTLLEARHEAFRPARVRLTSRTTPDRPLVLRLRAGQRPDQPQATIAGRVVDEHGQPCRDAVVSGSLLARRGRQLVPAQATTDERGEFLLEELVPGPYQLVARASGWRPARARPVRAGTGDVELILRRGAVLRGRVTEARGDGPVPGFSVIVEQRRGPLQRLGYRSETFFDPQGRFEIRGLEAQRYVVTVRAQGYAPSEPQEVTLPDRGAREVDITLSLGGQARGSVVDAASGQPIAWAQVVMEGPVGDPGLPVALSARTVTDQAGQFFISGLAPGRRSLMVEAEGYHQRILSGLTVRDDDALQDLQVELRAQEPEEDRRLEFVGIGAVLTARDEALVIVRVLNDGGASAAGLTVGDAILGVEGHAVTELGFNGAVEQIRGQEGTAVRLSVRRHADGSQVDLTVPRLRIES